MNPLFNRKIKLDQSDSEFLEMLAQELAFDQHGVSAVLRAIILQWSRNPELQTRRSAGHPIVITPVFKSINFTPEVYAVVERVAQERGYRQKGISEAVRIILREWQLSQPRNVGAFYVSMNA